MPDVNYGFLIGLEPKAIVEWFKKKGNKISWDWEDVWKEANLKSFSVAKAMRMDILQDIRSEVEKAIQTGTSFQEFKNNLTPILKNKGWWGKEELLNPKTGVLEKVQLGSPYRLKTIYNTNLNVSYAKGHYDGMQSNIKKRPYWMYEAVNDANTRPAHAKLDGKVFRADDPIWNTHYPPNGWGCRCSVRALDQSDLDEMGLKPSTGSDYEGAIKIDKGWDFNPGKEDFFPKLSSYEYSIAKQYLGDVLDGKDFGAFYEGRLKGNFPVAVLDEEYRKLIGAKSNTIVLSDETLKKQKESHPELKISEYYKLPDLISKESRVIIRDKEHTIVFINKDERYYVASVKNTVSKESLFLTSFRRVDDVKLEVDRISKKKGAIIIKNNL